MNANTDTVTGGNFHGQADKVMVFFIAQAGERFLGQCRGGMSRQFVQGDLTGALAWIKEKEQKVDQTVGPVKEAL